MKEKDQRIEEQINEKVDKKISTILEQGILESNIDMLSKMVDIKKDIGKIEKEEKDMMYKAGSSYNEGGSFGEYGEGSYGRRGVPGSGRGRYREGSFGRRGVKGTGRGRYRGEEPEEMMEEMMYHYGNYSESGQYGAEGEAMEALSSLMESAYEYFKQLKENANSQDEVKMMEHYFKKMGQM